MILRGARRTSYNRGLSTREREREEEGMRRKSAAKEVISFLRADSIRGSNTEIAIPSESEQKEKKKKYTASYAESVRLGRTALRLIKLSAERFALRRTGIELFN